MKKKELGKKGEGLAMSYLIDSSYQILAQNWRHSHQEIDIIAKENEILVFIEVKTRTNDYFGPPDEFVSDQQQQHIWNAAQAYMQEVNHDWEIRFDIISVLLKDADQVNIHHIKDAFWPDWE